MTVGERNNIADQLMALLGQQSGLSAGDQVAIAAMLAGKVISAAVAQEMRSAASKNFLTTMNAQLTLESAGEHRAMQPIGRFNMEDDE